MRHLKFHEKKLLKKVDFISWESDKNNLHEVKIMRRYHIQKREDYTVYNQMSRKIRDLARQLKDLDNNDSIRIRFSNQLLRQLYHMGLIPDTDNLKLADRVNATSFCRRRLSVVLVRNHMAENMKSAVQFIEAGHVRVGPEVINDPAFIVTRPQEDLITWTDASKIRRQLLEYNDLRDDFDINA